MPLGGEPGGPAGFSTVGSKGDGPSVTEAAPAGASGPDRPGAVAPAAPMAPRGAEGRVSEGCVARAVDRSPVHAAASIVDMSPKSKESRRSTL